LFKNPITATDILRQQLGLPPMGTTVVPHDFVGPLQPGTVRAPPPPKEEPKKKAEPKKKSAVPAPPKITTKPKAEPKKKSAVPAPPWSVEDKPKITTKPKEEPPPPPPARTTTPARAQVSRIIEAADKIKEKIQEDPEKFVKAVYKHQAEDAEKTAEELKQWTADPEAEYYTIPEEDFDSKHMYNVLREHHDPGFVGPVHPSKLDPSVIDLHPDKPGIQLSPEHTEMYMRGAARSFEHAAVDYTKAASDIQKQIDIRDFDFAGATHKEQEAFLKEHGQWKVDDKVLGYDEMVKHGYKLDLVPITHSHLSVGSQVFVEKTLGRLDLLPKQIGLVPDFRVRDGEIVFAGETVKPFDIHQYPGGIDFLKGLTEKERKALLDTVVETSPRVLYQGAKPDPWDRIGRGGILQALGDFKADHIHGKDVIPVGADQYIFKQDHVTTPVLVSETQLRDMIWKELTHTPSELKQIRFDELPGYSRYARSLGEAVHALPVGLVSFVKPEAAFEFQETFISPTKGFIGGTVTHFTSDYDYFDAIKKYPIETGFAAAGEIITMKAAGKAISYAAKAPVAVTKTAYAHLPATVKHTMHMKWAAAKFEVAKHVAPTIKKIQLHRPTLHTKYLDYTHGHKTFVDVYADKGLYSAMPKTGMAAESAKISYAGTKVFGAKLQPSVYRPETGWAHWFAEKKLGFGREAGIIKHVSKPYKPFTPTTPREFTTLKGDMWIKITKKLRVFKPYTPSESFVPAKTAARSHSLISKSVVKTKTWVDTKPFVRTEWKGVYDVPTSAYIFKFPVTTVSAALLSVSTPALMKDRLKSYTVKDMKLPMVSPVVTPVHTPFYKQFQKIGVLPVFKPMLDVESIKSPVKLPAYDLSFDTMQMQNVVQDQTQASAQAQVQLQKQLLFQMSKYEPVYSHKPVQHKPIDPSFKKPFDWFDDHVAESKLVKKRSPVDWDKAYRERTWKVPTMKDFLDIKSW
jgi:hypothetical protein